MSRFTSKQGGTNQFLHHTDKKKASFFKIIHPNIIKDQQLDLPIMFVKKYENDLSGHVTLKVPTGYVWNIKLKKANGRTYLSDGWKDFVDHHSICAGHVLTFRYDGNSSFYVIICDMTTVEIEYPSKKVKLENRTHGLETLVPGKNVVDNSTRKLTAQLGELSVKNGQLRKLVAEERIKDVMPSMASKPKNPYFVVVMQPSYVGGRCQLNVPGSFMKKHLGKGSQDITMCVLDDASHERIWGARYLCYNNWTKLAWKTFAKDNDLRKNDVCMFELARMKSATFKVSIFREVEEVIPKAVLSDASKLQVFNQSECRTAKKKKVMNKGKTIADRFLDCTVSTRPMLKVVPFESNYHFFTIKLCPTYVHDGLLQIPSYFIRNHLPKTESSVSIVDSKGRRWSMMYHLNSQGYLYHGWKTLVLGNNLKEGDVCAFELIDKQNFILRLSVLEDMEGECSSKYIRS